ncbi:MAG: 1-acyl-sn-glycerol-3-phosphate acyltransferase, partial [Pseudolabrys sp.]
PHIKELIARGAVDAVVSYGEPVRVDAAVDRKALTRQLEGAVRAMVTAALLKRPIPAAAAAPREMPAPATPATPLQQAPAS